MNESDLNGEAVSARIDGEHPADGSRVTLEALLQAPEAAERWALYQLVGDTLRDGAAGAGPARGDFVRAVMTGLSAESGGASANPVPVAPADPTGRGHQPPHHAGRDDPAANDAVFRWRAVAGLACLVAIGTVAWHLSSVDPASREPVMAESGVGRPPVETGPAPSATMIRDPRLDELIAQHRQAAGVSAFQNGSGFLRAATYEGPRR